MLHQAAEPARWHLCSCLMFDPTEPLAPRNHSHGSGAGVKGARLTSALLS